MVLYNFLYIWTFLKFVIYIFIKLFFIPIISKIILLIILLLTFHLCYKYPRKRFKKLSELRKYRMNTLLKYVIKTPQEHCYNIFIIIFFFSVSFIFIFYLRYINKENTIILIDYYYIILNYIKITPILECILNIIILILLFILYIILIIKLSKYFKFHLIKRHIYLIGGFNNVTMGNNWYGLKFFHGFLYKICLNESILVNFIEFIYNNLYFRYKKKYYGIDFDTLSHDDQFIIKMQSPVTPSCFTIKYYKIVDILWFFLLKGHYIILLFSFMYDLIFNDFQISLIFSILPWILVYDTYLRASKFVDNLYLPNDQFIHTVLYSKNIEIWDSNTLLIDGEFYDYDRFKIIYKKYMLSGFIKHPDCM